MALKVDDILITDKNVFVLSGGAQLIADIESAATTADFAETIDVNPWNLYTKNGKVIGNLYNSADFDLKSQILKSYSKISPKNKLRHEDYHMPSPSGYVGLCQFGDVGYGLTDFTKESFVATITSSDDYVANGNFCQYYYLSSISEEENNSIQPDLAYSPMNGVQYINEYPLNRYFSDFGDNDLDVSGTDIDKPTIYADSFLTKYFYNRNYSVDGHSENGKSITFDDMRTYYNIGQNGDLLYLVYRNDMKGVNGDYGMFRPKNQLSPTVLFELWTLGHMSETAIGVSMNGAYTKYATYTSDGYHNLFTMQKITSSDEYYVLRSYEPKDESFILYMAARSHTLAQLNYVTDLVYIPKAGAFESPYYYRLQYGDINESEIHGELLSNMTVIELDYSVMIGSHENGALCVVSKNYNYESPEDSAESSLVNFTPFLGPLLAGSPETPTLFSENTTGSWCDIYYNGDNILALRKKYSDKDGSEYYKIFLSTDYKEQSGKTFLKGRYFSATMNPSSVISDTQTITEKSADRSLNGFEPIFDYCPVEYPDFGDGIVLFVDDKHKSKWDLDNSKPLNGFNAIRVVNLTQGHTSTGVMTIPGKFKLTFYVAISQHYKHMPFTLYDSIDGKPHKKITSFSSTGGTADNPAYKKVEYTATESGNHEIKFEFKDECDSRGTCALDFALISNIEIAGEGFMIPPSNIKKIADGHFQILEAGAYDIKSGRYVFIQFDNGTVGACRAEEIFKNGNYVKLSYCGPMNESHALSAVIDSSGKYPVCKDMYFCIQSDTNRMLDATMSNVPFPLKQYKNLDSFVYAESALNGIYQYTSGGVNKIIQSFTTLPMTMREAVSASYGTGQSLVAVEQIPVTNHVYVSGNPISNSNGVAVKRFPVNTALHDASGVLVCWNPNSTGIASLTSDLYSPNSSSKSIRGLYLQYSGINYDMYAEGQDTYSSVTRYGCPNGIMNCKNHPNTNPYTVTTISHNRRGYSYPHPVFEDFVTAGTGLKVFEGPLGNMSIDDIEVINNFLVVKNYDVDGISEKTPPGDGVKGSSGPVPKYKSGGYVVVNMNSTDTLKSCSDLYDVDSLLDNTATTNAKFRFLYRLAPTRGMEVYPESTTDKEWAPYYAGTVVDFIKFFEGYYYIALHKNNSDGTTTYYDIIETESLIKEHQLKQLNGGRAVSDIRFFKGKAIVEYSKEKVPVELQWFYVGMSNIRHSFRTGEFDGMYEIDPVTTKMTRYGDNILLYGSNLYTHFNTAMDELTGECDIFSDMFAGMTQISSSDGMRSIAFPMYNRNNYITRYTGNITDVELTSKLDNDDESVPLSGVHSIGTSRFIVTDDAFDSESYGNGVRTSTFNKTFVPSRILDKVEELETKMSYGISGTAASGFTLNTAGLAFSSDETHTFTFSSGRWYDENLISVFDSDWKIYGLTPNSSSFTQDDTLVWSASRNVLSVNWTLSDIDEGCFYFVNGFTSTGSINGRYCTVFDRTNGRILISFDSKNVGGRDYDAGEVFSVVADDYEVIDAIHVTWNLSSSPSIPSEIYSNFGRDGFDIVIRKHYEEDETTHTLVPHVIPYAIDYSKVSNGTVPYEKIPCDEIYVELTDIPEFSEITEKIIDALPVVISESTYMTFVTKTSVYSASGTSLKKAVFDKNDLSSESSVEAVITSRNYDKSKSIRGLSLIIRETTSDGYMQYPAHLALSNGTFKVLYGKETVSKSPFAIKRYKIVEDDNDNPMMLAFYDANTMPIGYSEFKDKNGYDYSKSSTVTKIENEFTAKNDKKTTNYSIVDFDANSTYSYALYTKVARETSSTLVSKVKTVGKETQEHSFYTIGLTSKLSTLDTDFSAIRPWSRYVSSVNMEQKELFTVKSASKNAESGIIDTVTCDFGSAPVTAFTFDTIVTYNSSDPYDMNGSFGANETTAPISGSLFSNSSGTRTLSQPVVFDFTGIGEYTFNASNNWTLTRSSKQGERFAIHVYPTVDSSGKDTFAFSIIVDTKMRVATFNPLYSPTKREKGDGIDGNTHNEYQSTAAFLTKNYIINSIDLNLEMRTNISSTYELSSFDILPLGNDQYPISNMNDYMVGLAYSPSITSVFDSANISSSSYDSKWRTFGTFMHDMNIKSFINAHANDVVFSFGTAGLRYINNASTAATGFNFVDVNTTKTVSVATHDYRTYDKVVDLKLRMEKYSDTNQNSTRSSSYDTVETMYSLNRFTSQNIHKSNLFTIRIDDLGISDSPFLTDSQREQLTLWVKNHVSDIVTAIKPAQTELFDVLVD